MELSTHTLKMLLSDAAEVGAAQMAAKIAPKADRCTQREAYRLHGESRVKGWVRSGLVHPNRSSDGEDAARHPIYYSRAELMAADKAERINQRIA